MASSRSLPEAVRGCWYYIPESFQIEGGLNRAHQVLAFGVDGSFIRYQIKSGRRKIAEEGDYTFDGNFLIIRGRNTDTFRVRRHSFRRWSLEGKKKTHHLIRGLFDDADISLTDAALRDIRILPLRAQVQADFTGEHVIYRLTYDQDEEAPVLLATFFVEHHDDGRRWIGITPLAQGIEPKTWQRIMEDSFLDMFLGKPDDVRVVTLRLLDTDESRSFNYQVKR